MDIYIQCMLDGIKFPVIDRPTLDDDIVIEKVCDKLALKVFQWCGYNKIKDINELEYIKNDLIECVTYYKDGYEIARNLESYHGYTPDSELVDILSDHVFLFHNILSDLTFQWVLKYQIENKHQLNDEVNVIHKGKEYTGYIVKIDKKRAQYVVRIPELNHIKKGEATQGTLGLYYNFEDVDK